MYCQLPRVDAIGFLSLTSQSRRDVLLTWNARGESPCNSSCQSCVFQCLASGVEYRKSEEILQMLDLVDKNGVKSWVHVRKMREGGRVLEEMEQGRGRYRWVLEADIN